MAKIFYFCNKCGYHNTMGPLHDGCQYHAHKVAERSPEFQKLVVKTVLGLSDEETALKALDGLYRPETGNGEDPLNREGEDKAEGERKRMIDPEHIQAIVDLVDTVRAEASQEERLLRANGWIPLGKEAVTGEPGWTTLKRGIQGAVSQQEAIRILVYEQVDRMRAGREG